MALQDSLHRNILIDRNRQGGGVALYIRSSLACVRRLDLETPDTEMLWAEITSSHKRILVGVCAI